MTKFNVAVLIQVAGLVCLFVVYRPFNLVGWLVIVAGGVMYRQELKRRKEEKGDKAVPGPSDSQR